MFLSTELSIEEKIELQLNEKLNEIEVKGYNKLDLSLATENIFSKINTLIDEEVKKYKEEKVKITGLTLADLQLNLPYNIIGYDLYFTGEAYSWRGDYSILALDIQSEDTADGLTLSDLLDISDIRGSYDGWKGGSYYLGENTEMRIAMGDSWSNVVFVESAIIIDGIVQITLGFGKGYEEALDNFKEIN